MASKASRSALVNAPCLRTSRRPWTSPYNMAAKGLPSGGVGGTSWRHICCKIRCRIRQAMMMRRIGAARTEIPGLSQTQLALQDVVGIVSFIERLPTSRQQSLYRGIFVGCFRSGHALSAVCWSLPDRRDLAVDCCFSLLCSRIRVAGWTSLRCICGSRSASGATSARYRPNVLREDG